MQDLASSLGSTIGGFLGGNSLVERVAAGTAISTIAGRFGALVDQSMNTAGTSLGTSGSSLFDTAFQETLAGDGTVTSLGWGGDAIAGGLSSLLVGEAAQALGLHGFEATAFNTVACVRTYPRRRLSTRVRGMQRGAVARKTLPTISPTKCKTRDICP
jgi:hypothetical protein